MAGSRSLFALFVLSVIATACALPTGIPTGPAVDLVKGRIRGVVDGNANRYSVPYAEPPTGRLRFEPTRPANDWTGVFDASVTPPPCPQTPMRPGLDGLASVDEDCLYLQIYEPLLPLSRPGRLLPVFVWVHGGSFVKGASTAPGLNGSTLASETGMVVVTVQYRLGLLGFLKASHAGVHGNLAVYDVITALEFIRDNAIAFGADPDRVTLAGQSSGASLVKTLLAVPSADQLFSRAILHSAPLDYPDQSPAIAATLGSASLQALGCHDLGCDALGCLQRLSVEEILKAQDAIFDNATSISPALSQFQPFSPVVDGVLVKQDFIKAINGDQGGLTNQRREIIFTTVRNEAGETINGISDQPIPSASFDSIVQSFLQPASRAQTVIQSPLYKGELESSGRAGDGDSTRDELDRLGTDYIFRCPNQQAATNLTASGGMGGQIYLAEFDAGITYPFNRGIPFCAGKVCHQDDIYAVFGTGTDVTPTQQALSKEVAARWSAFVSTGSPNAQGYAHWPPVSTDGGLNLLRFKDGKESAVEADQRPAECSSQTGIWGRDVPFDAQLYA